MNFFATLFLSESLSLYTISMVSSYLYCIELKVMAVNALSLLILVSLGEIVILRATYVCVLQCNLCKVGQADVNLIINPALNCFYSMLDGRMGLLNATGNYHTVGRLCM